MSEQATPVLHKLLEGDGVWRGLVMFFCPGCKCGHWVRVERTVGPSWSWNGDMVRPTFEPSVLVTGSRFRRATPEDVETVPMRCHSFVRDGQIQFLSDCDHQLAGKTVPLAPF